MYEFKYISLDHYELHYTNIDNQQVVLPFTRTVEIAKEIQEIDFNARISIMNKLKEKGLTKNDFIVIKTIDGKQIIDESNWVELEERELKVQQLNAINNIFEKCFNMTLAELLVSMGFNQDDKAKEVELFMTKFTKIIAGKEETIPSGSKETTE